MIRVTCPNCQSKLNAKDHLAGQTRKCPKCAKPLLIAESGGETTNTDATKAPVSPTTEGSQVSSQAPQIKTDPTTPKVDLEHHERPQRLKPSNRYLICDKEKLIACWQNDSKGWMLKGPAGLLNAKRNRELLPNQGNFVLVELGLANTDNGLQLVGIMSYHLAASWALTKLATGDNEILTSITGPGTLNRQQKNTVRQIIISQLMHPVWKDAKEVLEFLSNVASHSPGIGTTSADEA